jgi:formylglycine-generating enzyme required for sulfatase activity
MAWYRDNSGWPNGTTRPVGQKEPNAWGLYDMHGNVLEWCADEFRDYPDGDVVDPFTAPQPGDLGNRVHRGGSWSTPESVCRSAWRGYRGPTYLNDICGLRVCAEVQAVDRPKAI